MFCAAALSFLVLQNIGPGNTCILCEILEGEGVPGDLFSALLCIVFGCLN